MKKYIYLLNKALRFFINKDLRGFTKRPDTLFCGTYIKFSKTLVFPLMNSSISQIKRGIQTNCSKKQKFTVKEENDCYKENKL